MPIFRKLFSCILRGSKFLCNSLEMVNIYLCLLLGNLHTNNCKNEFNGTCIHVTVNLLI